MAKRSPEVKGTPNTPYPEKRSSFPLGSLAPCSNLSTRSFGSSMLPPFVLSEVGDDPTLCQTTPVRSPALPCGSANYFLDDDHKKRISQGLRGEVASIVKSLTLPLITNC